MRLLAIDPGNQQSGWVVLDQDYRPYDPTKSDNDQLRDTITSGELGIDRIVIEMVASYGMPVGSEVFQTCVWIGRFLEEATMLGIPTDLIPRPDVKMHHTGMRGSKDSNITGALVERFTPGQPNRGKGTKKQPGWFHGFHADVWQSYALGVCWLDRHRQGMTS